MRKIKFILIIFFLFIIYIYTVNITNLQSKVVLMKGEKYNYKVCPFIEVTETADTFNGSDIDYNIEFKLFGKINLKTVYVSKINEQEVIPCGDLVGLKLYTSGVLVVGMSEVVDIDGNKKEAYLNSNIQEGDTIIKINNKETDSVNTLKEIVNEVKDQETEIEICRNGEIIQSKIVPIKTSKNEYKLGLWVRDAATGVGTLTYFDPKTNSFGALGHGISDTDTEKLINIESGELVTSKIVSIIKGKSGLAGEIRGTILEQPNIGIVNKNSNFGIFGVLNNIENLNIDFSKKVSIALRDEIVEGDADIYCNLDGQNVKQYKIKIEKIYKDNNFDNKSFLIRVVDDELLKKTGGIVRGLSGAPIIQNGKLVGAVTNVLVANPQIGYGVFADLMIKNSK